MKMEVGRAYEAAPRIRVHDVTLQKTVGVTFSCELSCLEVSTCLLNCARMAVNFDLS